MRVSYALIRLKFPSEKHLNIVLEALKPESRQALTRRFKVKVEGEGKELTLRFKAKDSSALRASINSYLRWISLINNVISIMGSQSP